LFYDVEYDLCNLCRPKVLIFQSFDEYTVGDRYPEPMIPLVWSTQSSSFFLRRLRQGVMISAGERPWMLFCGVIYSCLSFRTKGRCWLRVLSSEVWLKYFRANTCESCRNLRYDI
jgi:hypothetical protein